MSDKNQKTIVCRCEDVYLEEIEEVIERGFKELDEIKRLLRCGMGACQGRTCTRLIAQLISQKTGKPMGDMRFPRIRPPVRPVQLALFTAKKSKK